jgi:Big-like domain-containing protein
VASKGFRSAVARRGAALGLAVLIVTAVVGSLVLRAPGTATASSTSGYWLAGADGGVFNYGQAAFYGSAGSVPLNNPIVGFVPTHTAAGYWMVASDGGIFAFGDAAFLGSMGNKPLNRPISGMAATSSGNGYWLVASDGGVFAFGDAPFFGSLVGENLSKPVVDFAVSPTGNGYWMTTSDGQVYGFGDAAYYGSVSEAVDLNKRIQALAPTPTGHGYWLVAADGGIFAFGDAGYYGTAAGKAEKRVVDIASTVTGRGYYMVTANGQVFPFGDATNYGDPSHADLSNKIVALAAAIPSNGTGLKAVDDNADGDEDAPLQIDVVANDTAPSSGGGLTLQSVSPAEHGTTHVAGNRVAYDPAPDYHGPDSFTYTVTDGGGATSTGTVRLTMAPVNDKPSAVDDEATITDGGATTVDVVANDRGLGDGLKAVTVSQGPAHGEATVQPDQKIAYTPTAGFNGTDTFEYRVTDSDDESSTGKVKVAIGGANHIPKAADDSLNIRSGRASLLNVTSNDDVADGVREVRFADANGAPQDAVDTSTASGGTARRNGTKIEYTAPAGTFTGSDTFTYVVVDNNGDVSPPATVRANVVRNQVPQVKNGTVTVPQNRQAVGSIAKLGWDPEKDTLTFVLRSSPAGQLTLEPDGRFVYQAPTGVDVDDFSFVANDGNSDSDEGHLNIEVTDQYPGSSTTTTTDSASTTTTAPPAGPPGQSSNTRKQSSTTQSTGKSSTTETTGKSSTTETTGKSSTSQSTDKSSTSQTTGRSSAQTKSKKQSSSNNRGKSTSSSKKSKAFLVPLIPLAAAPAVSRQRRRRRRARR